jgi:hypothetical protein
MKLNLRTLKLLQTIRFIKTLLYNSGRQPGRENKTSCGVRKIEKKIVLFNILF